MMVYQIDLWRQKKRRVMVTGWSSYNWKKILEKARETILEREKAILLARYDVTKMGIQK